MKSDQTGWRWKRYAQEATPLLDGIVTAALNDQVGVPQAVALRRLGEIAVAMSLPATSQLAVVFATQIDHGIGESLPQFRSNVSRLSDRAEKEIAQQAPLPVTPDEAALLAHSPLPESTCSTPAPHVHVDEFLQDPTLALYFGQLAQEQGACLVAFLEGWSTTNNETPDVPDALACLKAAAIEIGFTGAKGGLERMERAIHDPPAQRIEAMASFLSAIFSIENRFDRDLGGKGLSSLFSIPVAQLLADAPRQPLLDLLTLAAHAALIGGLNEVIRSKIIAITRSVEGLDGNTSIVEQQGLAAVAAVQLAFCPDTPSGQIVTTLEKIFELLVKIQENTPITERESAVRGRLCAMGVHDLYLETLSDEAASELDSLMADGWSLHTIMVDLESHEEFTDAFVSWIESAGKPITSRTVIKGESPWFEFLFASQQPALAIEQTLARIDPDGVWHSYEGRTLGPRVRSEE
jgi:hypothetical protein